MFSLLNYSYEWFTKKNEQFTLSLITIVIDLFEADNQNYFTLVNIFALKLVCIVCFSGLEIRLLDIIGIF